MTRATSTRELATASRLEDIEFLLLVGERHAEAIGPRVGLKPRSVQRALLRADRRDLAAMVVGLEGGRR